MKRSVLFFSLIASLVLITDKTYSQQIEGKWYGTLNVRNTNLRLSFHIQKIDSLYAGTFDSPDQGAFGIALGSVKYSNSVLHIECPSLNIEYNGIHTGDKFLGTFKQAGLSLQLNLSRRVPEGLGRPQEPKEPFPYKTEELFFVNREDSIVLAGTLTTPNSGKIHNAVILISGSGPQNRNGEIMGHKPFLVLSDFLSRNGVAVLRYDERGVGMSGGNFSISNSLDLARDVKWAVEYLKSREDIAKIGLIGHSEGGIIAPIVATETEYVSFIVLMAAPGIKGRDVIMDQQELISRVSGATDEDIEAYKKLNKKIFDLIENKDYSHDSLKVKITQILKEETGGELTATQIKQQLSSLLSPWMLFFLKYDPAPVLTKVNCPVLAINGKKDLQVSYKRNLDSVYKALTGETRQDNNIVTHSNTNVKTIVFEDLNHMLQTAHTGHPKEYSSIEETLNPGVLTTILEWINEITG
ncbi:MAG: alpha/beta hydrolase family protein [Bacteroidales bacterium]